MLYSPPHNSSWVELLPGGHQGTWRTLEAMRYLVRKDYRSPYVQQFIRLLKAKAGQESMVGALFVCARDLIQFADDPPGMEKVSDFQRTTETGVGDCDDKSVWLATALLACDIPAQFVVQSYGRTWDHVYVEFYDWSQWRWVALDPTADGHDGVPIAGIGWRQPLNPRGYEMRFSI